jgi:hypothetical protein
VNNHSADAKKESVHRSRFSSHEDHGRTSAFYGLEDDLIKNELDLTGGPPIDHPIDPRLRALPLAPSNNPSNDTPIDTPAPPRKRGRGPGNKPWMKAKRKRETAEAAAGATEHGEDAADIATARSEAARSAEAPKPKRAGKQASKR